MSTTSFGFQYVWNSTGTGGQTAATVTDVFGINGLFACCVDSLFTLDGGSYANIVWIAPRGSPTLGGTWINPLELDYSEYPFEFSPPPYPEPIQYFTIGDGAMLDSTNLYLTWQASGAADIPHGYPAVNDLRFAITTGTTVLGGSGAAINSDCSVAGPIMATTSSTVYLSYTQASTGDPMLIKGTSVTTTPSYAAPISIPALPARGGLARVGSILVINSGFQIYTSSDDGATWVSGTMLPNSGFRDVPACQFYEVNGVSAWVCAYYNTSDNKIHLNVSNDNGVTWSDTVVSGTLSGTPKISVYISTSSHYLVQWLTAAGSPQALESYDGISWTTVANTLPPTSLPYVTLSRLTNSPQASSGFDGGIGSAEAATSFYNNAGVSPTFTDYGQDITITLTEQNINPDDYISSTSGGGSDQTEQIGYASTAGGGSDQTTLVSYTATAAGGSAQTSVVSYLATAGGGADQTSTVPYISTASGGADQTQNIDYISPFDALLLAGD